jgi:hypothetical protein
MGHRFASVVDERINLLRIKVEEQVREVRSKMGSRGRPKGGGGVASDCRNRRRHGYMYCGFRREIPRAGSVSSGEVKER